MPLRVDEVQQIDHRKRELKKKLYTELTNAPVPR